MKPVLSLICIGSLAIMTLFGACSKAPDADTSKQENPTPVENAKPAEDAKPAEIRIETRKIDIQTDKETISGEYMLFNLEKLDPVIEKSINELIDNERRDVAELIAGDNGHMTLTIKTEVSIATPDAIDFAVKLDRTIAGLAHPSASVHTFMFNPKDATRLSVNDLIASHALTPDYLSAETRRQIPGILKSAANIDVSEDSIAPATEPNAENFAAIVRRNTPDAGYRVYFAPGDLIGPYRDFVEVNLAPLPKDAE